MKTPIVIDRDAKIITVTKEFLIAAGCFDSPEYTTHLELLQKYPDYTITHHKKKNSSGDKVNGNLTYKDIEDFIANHEKDEAKCKAIMDEYQTLKQFLKGRKGAYITVKNWFLSKYEEVFNQRKEQLEAQKREERAKKTLYVPTSEKKGGDSSEA